MVKTVLVTGSTGLQAKALVKSLLTSNAQTERPEDKFRVLALTRNPSSPPAESLKTECQNDPNIDDSGLNLIKGDLNDEAGLRAIFEEEKKKDGIWGVHIVLPFPGLGHKVDVETKQGITVASLAFEYNISYTVFSSAARVNKATEGTASHKAKAAVEDHIKSLGQKGLKYSILEPAAFMELFQGPLGPLSVAVFRAGLPSDTKVQLIASEDIGNIAGALFRNPEPHFNRTILVIGDVLTVNEQEKVYRNVMGRARPASPSILAKLVLKTSSAAKEIVNDLRKEHEARIAGPGGFERGLTESKEIYPNIMTYETWLKKGTGREPPKGWNKLSLFSLIMGKKAQKS